MLEVSQFSLAFERFTGEVPSISVAKPVACGRVSSRFVYASLRQIHSILPSGRSVRSNFVKSRPFGYFAQNERMRFSTGSYCSRLK